jgi:hypothetical protein
MLSRRTLSELGQKLLRSGDICFSFRHSLSYGFEGQSGREPCLGVDFCFECAVLTQPALFVLAQQQERLLCSVLQGYGVQFASGESNRRPWLE